MGHVNERHTLADHNPISASTHTAPSRLETAVISLSLVTKTRFPIQALLDLRGPG